MSYIFIIENLTLIHLTHLTFRAIISWEKISAPRAFMTFFFEVLRNFWRYFRKNWVYGSKVTQHYVIERRLKI